MNRGRSPGRRDEPPSLNGTGHYMMATSMASYSHTAGNTSATFTAGAFDHAISNADRSLISHVGANQTAESDSLDHEDLAFGYVGDLQETARAEEEHLRARGTANFRLEKGRLSNSVLY